MSGDQGRGMALKSQVMGEKVAGLFDFAVAMFELFARATGAEIVPARVAPCGGVVLIKAGCGGLCLF